jgi:hypothetical protein
MPSNASAASGRIGLPCRTLFCDQDRLEHDSLKFELALGADAGDHFRPGARQDQVAIGPEHWTVLALVIPEPGEVLPELFPCEPLLGRGDLLRVRVWHRPPLLDNARGGADGLTDRHRLLGWRHGGVRPGDVEGSEQVAELRSNLRQRLARDLPGDSAPELLQVAGETLLGVPDGAALGQAALLGDPIGLRLGRLALGGELVPERVVVGGFKFVVLELLALALERGSGALGALLGGRALGADRGEPLARRA